MSALSPPVCKICGSSHWLNLPHHFTVVLAVVPKLRKKAKKKRGKAK